MCGINGIYAYHYASNPIDAAELVRTRDHMAARGPDNAGHWVSADHHAAFGHRRLSIIDLSPTGAQPMCSADGALVVTFNGEIYNYRELRRRLEAKGRRFRSTSDTEVLLHLYAEHGEAMVHQLRGMFAFAIWDAQRRVMFLARDPYGIKPLYYADDGWTFRFSSQVKALLAGGAISRDPEPAAQVGFYLWGSVPEPYTTCRCIRALPAGCLMVVDSLGAGEPRRYHSIAQAYRAADAGRRCTPAFMQAEMREALLDSVRHHLVADVPIGAFLSAGIDSSTLIGLMRDAGQRDIQTVTLAFPEFRGHPEDEAPLAERVAHLYGTRHTTRVVTPREFAADLPRILEAMDQPSIDGINIWFAAKAAHELGLKVAISGLGGDELFGSYPSFRDIPRWVGWMAVPGRIPLLGRMMRMLAERLPGISARNPKAAGMLELGGNYAGAYMLRRGLFMPWELDQVLDRETVSAGLRRLNPLKAVSRELEGVPRSAFARVATLEASLHMRNQLLRDADWASMAHSVEMRMPLVDSVLLSRVAPLLCASHRRPLKAQLAATVSNALTHELLSRPKSGFMTPVRHWQRHMPVTTRAPKGPNGGPWARHWASVVATSA